MNDRLILFMVLGLLVAFLLTNCGPGGEPQPPVGTPDDEEILHAEANVEEVQIQILESFPVQVNVVAQGTLPDACTTIDQIEQRREEDVFFVTITTARPAGLACAEVIEPFEQVVPLDVVGLSAGEYTVDVNGVRETFELAVDNIPPTED